MKFICSICGEEVAESNDGDDDYIHWVHTTNEGDNIWHRHAREFFPIEERNRVGEDILECSVINILAFEKEDKVKVIDSSPIKVKIIEVDK
jgi:hypothetical protein